jgi:uncharacterized protein
LFVYLFVILVAIAAGAFSGVVGTGSSLMLIPILVQAYGPKRAMPVMAITAIIGNISRLALWWRQIDWRAAGVYAAAGMPCAALGAHTLLALPSWIIDACLGLFFWIMIFAGRRMRASNKRISLPQLAMCGAAIGYLTGLVLSTGPLSVPAFTAYGLSGGGFLGTEAASALALYMTKVGTFFAQDALSLDTVLIGLLVGAGVTVGTVAGKAFVLKMPPRVMHRIVDGLLLVSGAVLLWSAWAHREGA